MKIYRTHFSYGLLFLSMGLSACDKKAEVKVYRVAKGEAEPAPAQVAMPDHSNMGPMPGMGGSLPAGAAAQPSLFTGTPPAQWEAQQLTSMRQASYLVKGDNGAVADVSIIVLSGAAGGKLENVNRWLSQLGQPAITDAQLANTAQQVASPLGEVTVVDLEGLPEGGDAAKDGRILAGIASTGDKTIFFKMRGNAPLAASQKAGFIEWIGSVREAAPATTQETVASPAPDAPAANPHVAQLPAAQIKWSAPDGWKSIPPASMRYASFAIPGPNGETADVSVSFLGGDGGGDLANVNRWRGQIGLEPLDAEGLKALIVPVTGKDSSIFTVDMTGSKNRILAAWALVDGRSWFFKLLAPEQLAGDQKATFVKFLESVQFQP